MLYEISYSEIFQYTDVIWAVSKEEAIEKFKEKIMSEELEPDEVIVDYFDCDETDVYPGVNLEDSKGGIKNDWY